MPFASRRLLKVTSQYSNRTWRQRYFEAWQTRRVGSRQGRNGCYDCHAIPFIADRKRVGKRVCHKRTFGGLSTASPFLYTTEPSGPRVSMDTCAHGHKPAPQLSRNASGEAAESEECGTWTYHDRTDGPDNFFRSFFVPGVPAWSGTAPKTRHRTPSMRWDTTVIAEKELAASGSVTADCELARLRMGPAGRTSWDLRSAP